MKHEECEDLEKLFNKGEDITELEGYFNLQAPSFF